VESDASTKMKTLDYSGSGQISDKLHFITSYKIL